MDNYTREESPSTEKEAPTKKRRLNQESDTELRDLSPVPLGESLEAVYENISSEKAPKSNAERNREYRERIKQNVALANRLKAEGKDVPSHLEHAVQKHEKEKERNRKSIAQKRKLGKEKLSKESTRDEGVISGPSSRVDRSLIQPMFRDSVTHPPTQNTWLDYVIEVWDSYLISSVKSLHSVGFIILKKLSSLPNPLPSAPVCDTLIKLLGKPTRGSIAPSLRLVGKDLLGGKDHNVVEFITRSPESGISGVDIMLSMTNLLTMCDMNSPERRLYGALDIQLAENGIKLCKYRATPYDNDKRFLVDPEHLTITLTPPGAITHTHADYYGRHQYFVHLFGHKIWLLWPPTKKNLDIYGKYHTQATPVDLTSRCIDELEGLQAFYAKEEQAFVMMPNVLHACISITMSSHLGTWVWMLPEYKTSLSMVDWGLDWLACKAGTDAPISDYKEEFGTIKSEIDSWKRLIKENQKDDDSKEAKKILKILESKYSEVQLLFK